LPHVKSNPRAGESGFNGIGNMTAKEIRSGNTLRPDPGDDLNYRPEYAYKEGHAALGLNFFANML
jgi:hypothetical protein